MFAAEVIRSRKKTPLGNRLVQSQTKLRTNAPRAISDFVHDPERLATTDSSQNVASKLTDEETHAALALNGSEVRECAGS